MALQCRSRGCARRLDAERVKLGKEGNKVLETSPEAIH
jgi:hypothetical protein